jgi:hypothetical protein
MLPVFLTLLLEVSVQNFMQSGGSADYLHPFIWSHVSDLMWWIRQRNSKCGSHFAHISENV